MASQNSVVAPLSDIQALSDLTGYAEMSRGDSPGRYTIYWKVYGNGEVFLARISKGKLERDIQKVKSQLRWIPDEKIYPQVPAGTSLTTVPSRPDAELYIKRPSFMYYYGKTDWIPAIFLAQAQIMERISKTPHDNIAQYYGCFMKGSRLMAIVLKRYKCNLQEHIEKGEMVDTERFMAKLESAVYHLHSLGLAHNNLNPGNIMLDADNMPVLIDFSICQPFGAELMRSGAVGWVVEEFLRSQKEHDIFGLDRMRRWLADPDQKASKQYRGKCH
ncbi:kinase-like protein [Xylariaceae sp. FL0662B]|nr:kinase-like protein [Xylariaceae sp. FL0662B]